MSPRSPIGERPSASRIDDLGSAHTGACPKPGHFSGLHTLEPPAGLASAAPASALLRTQAPMR
jgi:hypothetical protein